MSDERLTVAADDRFFASRVVFGVLRRFVTLPARCPRRCTTGDLARGSILDRTANIPVQRFRCAMRLSQQLLSASPAPIWTAGAALY